MLWRPKQPENGDADLPSLFGKFIRQNGLATSRRCSVLVFRLPLMREQ
nr:hypothetical protein [uncultured Kingella sp.]